MDDGTAVRESPDTARRTKIIFLSWAALVVAFFIWQSVGYGGLVARAGEWQFHDVGGYYPALTLIVMIILFGIPLFYIFSGRANRDVAERSPRAPANRFLQVLTGLALVAALAAVLVAVLPIVRDARLQGAVVPVTLGDGSARDPAPGPVRLSGIFLLDRVAVDGVWLFGYRQAIRYLPVVPNADKPASARFFVQDSLGGAAPGPMTRTGMLRRDALPGHVVQLYRDAGFEIPSPYYVLFTDTGVERLRSMVAAAALAFCALLFALAALFQRWRLSRLSSGRRTGTPHAIG